MNSRRMIYLGAVVGFVAAWLTFLYLPTLKEQKQLQARVSEKRTQLDDFNLTLAQLPVFIQTRENLKAKLQEASSRLYAKDDLMRLFRELERTADANSLALIEITPPINELLELNKATPGTPEPQFLNMTLTLQGDFLAFGHFVEELERAPYFRSVTSCAIRSATDGSSRITHTLGFKALLGGAREEA